MTSVRVRRIRLRTQVWWTLPLHQIMSTLGVLVLAALLTFSTSSASRARQLLTETPYFPVQIGLAFVAGFILQRCLHHRVMLWVWLLPFLILSVSFILSPLPFVGRLEHFFGWACRPESRCFDQLAATLPFYTAASYSSAAFLRRTLQTRAEPQEAAK